MHRGYSPVTIRGMKLQDPASIVLPRCCGGQCFQMFLIYLNKHRKDTTIHQLVYPSFIGFIMF